MRPRKLVFHSQFHSFTKSHSYWNGRVYRFGSVNLPDVRGTSKVNIGVDKRIGNLDKVAQGYSPCGFLGQNCSKTTFPGLEVKKNLWFSNEVQDNILWNVFCLFFFLWWRTNTFQLLIWALLYLHVAWRRNAKALKLKNILFRVLWLDNWCMLAN